MTRFWSMFAAIGLVAIWSVTALAQPPQDRERDSKDGPPGGRREGGPPPGHPGPWQPGKVMPPHVKQQLKLTSDQEKQLDELENEVRERILKILTDAQKAQLKQMRPGGPPRDDRGTRSPRQGRRRVPLEGRPDGPPDEGPPPREK